MDEKSASAARGVQAMPPWTSDAATDFGAQTYATSSRDAGCVQHTAQLATASKQHIDVARVGTVAHSGPHAPAQRLKLRRQALPVTRHAAAA
eukprot:7376815-Prymnesium_polylepis.1